MRRRIRLTEGQLRNVVERASRRVIQEMMGEGFWSGIKSGLEFPIRLAGSGYCAGADALGTASGIANRALSGTSVGNTLQQGFNGLSQRLSGTPLGNAYQRGLQRFSPARQ